MGSCGERKNPLGLIRAFRAAFPAGEQSLLAIKVSRASANPHALGPRCGPPRPGDPRVKLIDAVLPRADLDAMLAACDCYVSLHRAEGLGLAMAEAMLRGKPVIATNYSGNLDFMTADTAHLVRYKLVPVGPGHPPYDADAALGGAGRGARGGTAATRLRRPRRGHRAWPAGAGPRGGSVFVRRGGGAGDGCTDPQGDYLKMTRV